MGWITTWTYAESPMAIEDTDVFDNKYRFDAVRGDLLQGPADLKGSWGMWEWCPSSEWRRDDRQDADAGDGET